MPKCNKWLPSAAPPVPPPNGPRELFKRQMKATGVTYEELGKRLHVSANSARTRMSRGIWEYRDLQAWAVALEIDAESLGKAILYR